MKKPLPFLWFDDNAEEAVDFYASIFGNSRVLSVTRYSDQSAAVSGMPRGSIMTITFEIEGEPLTALNGGPIFEFTPATSFFVSCDTETEIDRLWKNLVGGGKVLMDLDSYPFSEKFGWLNDKFGVSWQLNLATRPQKITPFLMFVGDKNGKAREAIDFYTSIFDDSRVQYVHPYGEGQRAPAGAVQHAAFTVIGRDFMAMDGGDQHDFTFTPSVSFLVECESQAEVDRLWASLSAGGKEDQCGWVTDRFGVTWQIVPSVLLERLQDGDAERARRVAEAMFKMSKIDSTAIEAAYAGDGAR